MSQPTGLAIRYIYMTSAKVRKTEKARFLWWGTAVLLLAAIFRLFMLHDVPPGLSQDEVLNADIVQFIRGGHHALFFREGFGHEPLYHYFSVPFQWLLGDNVLSIRLPAVTLGLLLVALTLRWTRREFGWGTAVIAGLGLAISWWPIVFSRVGIRPILEPVLLLLFAWFWPKRPWLAGLFLGLSVYSYTGARVVFAIPLFLALYLLTQSRRGTEEKSQIQKLFVVLGVSLVVAVPLFFTLWADPTLQQRVEQLAEPLEELEKGNLQPILQSTAATLGVFSFTGDPRWTYSLPGRPLFDWGTAVFFYLGLLFSLWRWQRPRFAFLLIWLGVALIPSAITPQSPSTVRLVGALPVVYVLLGVGGTAVYDKILSVNGSSKTHLVLTVVLVGLLGINLFRTINDGFVNWAQAETTRLAHYQTVLLDIARHWQANPTENSVIADAFYEPIDKDSLIRNLGADPQFRWVQTGANVAGAIVIPVKGNGRFYVPEFAAPSANLLEFAGIPNEPQFRSQNEPSFAIYSLPNTAPELTTLEPILLEDRISLIGYEILDIEDKPLPEIFTLWRVENDLPADLAAFLHLVDADNRIVAQHDGLDAAPTTLQVGDLVLQRHVLAANASLLAANESLLAGSYTLFVGLYERGSNVRWRSGGQAEDRFPLTQLFFDE